MNTENYIIKCNFLGDSGVGKTSLGKLFENNKFTNFINPTIGVEYFSKVYTINKNKYKLQIWDLSGNRNFDNIINIYMKKVQIIFIIFDLSNKNSFNNIIKWINKTKENTTNSKIILIGNKSDLSRKVSNNEINNITSQYNMNYNEISLKNNIGIEKLNNDIIKTINNIIPKKTEKKRDYCYCFQT